MKIWLALCFEALVLVGCDGPNRTELDEGVIVEVEPLAPQELSTQEPAAWEPCPADSENADAYFGNHWWGELTLCAGEIRVRLRADSIDLGGPVLNAEVETKDCFRPERAAAIGDNVDPSFFRKRPSQQMAEVKDLVRRTVREVKPACGGPYYAEALFDETFPARFAAFADAYWRSIPSKELTAALLRQQRSTPAN